MKPRNEGFMKIRAKKKASFRCHDVVRYSFVSTIASVCDTEAVKNRLTVYSSVTRFYFTEFPPEIHKVRILGIHSGTLNSASDNLFSIVLALIDRRKCLVSSLNILSN
jgi:hypothetical protein